MKLSGLKLSAAKQPANVGEEQVRRNKIVKRLVEQRELATAVAAGAERVNDFATPGFINSVCIWLLPGLFLFLGWWIDPYRARQGFFETLAYCFWPITRLDTLGGSLTRR